LGGAGFIGSHLVDKLIKLGRVTVYDSLSSGKSEYIKHHFGVNGFAFIESDLLDLEELVKATKDQDVVFHLAANPEVRAGMEDTSLDLKQGTIATYNVLEAMKINSVKKVVFASSSTVYGETQLRLVSEDYGPLRPISLYGASKLASEGLISAFCHIFKMQAWILRFANVVGKRATHGVIFDFINKLSVNSKKLEILGDGTQKKPYIHVDDCVDGLLHCFQHSNSEVNVYNLGTQTSTTVDKIARIIIREMGLKGVQITYTGGKRGWVGDVPHIRLNTKAMKKLGWQAGYTSDGAVLQAVRDILRNL
jgi:UDP-glucose 4-epimerase